MEDNADIIQVDYNENEEDGSYKNKSLNGSFVRKARRIIYSGGKCPYNCLCGRIYSAIFCGGCKSICVSKGVSYEYGSAFFHEYSENILLCYLPITERSNASFEGYVSSTGKLFVSSRKGKQFPEGFGNELYARITPVSAESMKRKHKSAEDSEKDLIKRRHMEDKPEVVALEYIFRKTRAKPHIYYKPLTEEEVSLYIG